MNINTIRSMWARAAGTQFEGEFQTAYAMADRFTRASGLDDWELAWQGTSYREAEYILHNLNTARDRWAAMDREKKQEAPKTKKPRTNATKSRARTAKAKAQANPNEAPEAPAGYKMVWVREHTRTSKAGKVSKVAGHWRKQKIR